MFIAGGLTARPRVTAMPPWACSHCGPLGTVISHCNLTSGWQELPVGAQRSPSLLAPQPQTPKAPTRARVTGLAWWAPARGPVQLWAPALAANTCCPWST